MSAPPLVPDKPLGRAIESVLGDSPARVLVVGSSRIAARLAAAGHAVTHRPDADTPEPGAASGSLFDAPVGGLEPFDALVLLQVLRRRPDLQQDLARLVQSARPGAQLILVEQAAWGSGGRWIGALLGRLFGRPLVTDATELGALCLNAGLCGLRQTWPQGLRSLVLTTGRVHPLARELSATASSG